MTNSRTELGLEEGEDARDEADLFEVRGVGTLRELLSIEGIEASELNSNEDGLLALRVGLGEGLAEGREGGAGDEAAELQHVEKNSAHELVGGLDALRSEEREEREEAHKFGRLDRDLAVRLGESGGDEADAHIGELLLALARHLGADVVLFEHRLELGESFIG